MRLDKFFSSAHILTRKETRDEIKKGNILVNGVPAKRPEDKIDPYTDEISLSGKIVEYKRYIYIALNKPAGVVSATEDARDKTVLDLLPPELQSAELFPCGRLDKDTVGLVILTNDGKAAHAALSPKRGIRKKYRFETADPYGEEDRTAIEKGITLKDGYTTKPCRIERTGEKDGYITLTEGKYHEIKRLFGARGNKITFLERVSFGDITLGDLGRGEWRYLTDEEIKFFEIKE